HGPLLTRRGQALSCAAPPAPPGVAERLREARAMGPGTAGAGTMLRSRGAMSAQTVMSMAAPGGHHLATTPAEALNTHVLIITAAPSCSGLFPDSLPPTIWRAPVRLTARGNELVGGTIVSGGLPGTTDLQITVHFLTIDSSSVTGFVAGENWLKIPGQLYPL